MAFDFDVTLGTLIEIVENTLTEACDHLMPQFEWVASYESKAREKLLKGTSSKGFKIPKTPARKKMRQQKKRLLSEEDDESNGYHINAIPTKKGKLSNEENELESIGGRPRRQASTAAKSKIQKCLKMTLNQKLRRPDDETEANTSANNKSNTSQHEPMECGSPVLNKAKYINRNKANETVTLETEVVTSPPMKTKVSTQDEDVPNACLQLESTGVEAGKPTVNFNLEATFTKENASTSTEESCSQVELADREEEIVHSIPEPAIPIAVAQSETSKPRGRPRRAKKNEDVVVKEKKVVKVEEEEQERKSLQAQPEIAPMKTYPLRKQMKPTEEKSVAVVVATTASPRATRIQKPSECVRSRPSSVAHNSPRLEKTPSKRNLQDQVSRNLQFAANNSSPVRKVFTPKIVFSPFKASSVKTKVEAFEAALGSVPGSVSTTTTKTMMPVLPEARVLLKRLTDEEINAARFNAERPPKPTKEPRVLLKRLDDEEDIAASAIVEQPPKPTQEAKRCTFVLDASDETSKKPERQSVAHKLARKSVDKAKHIALAAARNKHINSVVHNETAESPNIHVNKNASSIMSKFRFPSGSSGSSSSSLNRYVAMTQGKTHLNVVTCIGTFTGTKPVSAMPTKATEEDEVKRKELELKRLKEKEEEVSRKREELIKAKAEEQKRKHDARAKRAAEQRMLRAKQLGEEKKQKLENKEEKSANLKQKLLAENQEKAERVRAAVLQRQKEAEQRRKAEELQKQQEWEEEQLRLAALKKEQEEHLAKKQVEAEKLKAVASTAAAPAAPLNTTITLPSSSSTIADNCDNYSITPVRVTKKGKIFNPDNYDIADMRSDDSTDDDSKPKKTIPSWARSHNLRSVLVEQGKNLVEIDNIFPPETLLQDPNLNDIFKIKRARFNKRTSSAVWKTPPANYI